MSLLLDDASSVQQHRAPHCLVSIRSAPLPSTTHFASILSGHVDAHCSVVLPQSGPAPILLLTFVGTHCVEHATVAARSAGFSFVIVVLPKSSYSAERSDTLRELSDLEHYTQAYGSADTFYATSAVFAMIAKSMPRGGAVVIRPPRYCTTNTTNGEPAESMEVALGGSAVGEVVARASNYTMLCALRVLVFGAEDPYVDGFARRVPGLFVSGLHDALILPLRGSVQAEAFAVVLPHNTPQIEATFTAQWNAMPPQYTATTFSVNTSTDLPTVGHTALTVQSPCFSLDIALQVGQNAAHIMVQGCTFGVALSKSSDIDSVLSRGVLPVVHPGSVDADATVYDVAGGLFVLCVFGCGVLVFARMRAGCIVKDSLHREQARSAPGPHNPFEALPPNAMEARTPQKRSMSSFFLAEGPLSAAPGASVALHHRDSLVDPNVEKQTRTLSVRVILVIFTATITAVVATMLCLLLLDTADDAIRTTANHCTAIQHKANIQDKARTVSTALERLLADGVDVLTQRHSSALRGICTGWSYGWENSAPFPGSCMLPDSPGTTSLFGTQHLHYSVHAPLLFTAKGALLSLAAPIRGRLGAVVVHITRRAVVSAIHSSLQRMAGLEAVILVSSTSGNNVTHLAACSTAGPVSSQQTWMLKQATQRFVADNVAEGQVRAEEVPEEEEDMVRDVVHTVTGTVLYLRPGVGGAPGEADLTIFCTLRVAGVLDTILEVRDEVGVSVVTLHANGALVIGSEQSCVTAAMPGGFPVGYASIAVVVHAPRGGHGWCAVYVNGTEVVSNVFAGRGRGGGGGGSGAELLVAAQDVAVVVQSRSMPAAEIALRHHTGSLLSPGISTEHAYLYQVVRVPLPVPSVSSALSVVSSWLVAIAVPVGVVSDVSEQARREGVSRYREGVVGAALVCCMVGACLLLLYFVFVTEVVAATMERAALVVWNAAHCHIMDPAPAEPRCLGAFLPEGVQRETRSLLFGGLPAALTAPFPAVRTKEGDHIFAAVHTLVENLRDTKGHLPQYVLHDMEQRRVRRTGASDTWGPSFEDSSDATLETCGSSTTSIRSQAYTPSHSTSTGQSPVFPSPDRRPTVNSLGVFPATSLLVPGLHRRRFSLVLTNVKGTHTILETEGEKRLTVLYGEVVSALSALHASMGGVSERFNGDKFLCGFNTVRPLRANRKAACETALLIPEVLQTLGVTTHTAVANGEGRLGTCGKTVLQFCCFSAVLPWCHLLERHATLLNLPNLADHFILDELKSQYTRKLVDDVKYAKRYTNGFIRISQVMWRKRHNGNKAAEWVLQQDTSGTTVTPAQEKDHLSKWNQFAQGVMNQKWSDAEAARAVLDTEARTPTLQRFCKAFKVRNFVPLDWCSR